MKNLASDSTDSFLANTLKASGVLITIMLCALLLADLVLMTVQSQSQPFSYIGIALSHFYIFVPLCIAVGSMFGLIGRLRSR